MSAAVAPVTPSLSRDIVAASLDHLTRITLPQGRFVYSHELDDIGSASEGYNLLRHCGTLWFMARAARQATPTPELAEALQRATSFLGRKMHPTPWARPDSPSLALVGKDMVKLGGLGLGLLALTELRALSAFPGFTSAALPVGLDETIARMRRYTLDEIDGDDFRHKRSFPDGAVQAFRSDYYTGEAIFGLLATGEPDAELTRVTTAILRRGNGLAQQSHWMAYAAAEAVERQIVPEALGSAYLTGLMEAMVGDTLYRHRRQSTPVACRTEAMTRVLMLARRVPGILSPDLLQRIKASAAENLHLQLDWYKDGQFWKGDNERKVQIDYIQHNATAFLHWAELGEG
jgi:hypothetical protein